MILSNDTKPERDLYFLGGRVIEVLMGYDDKKVDYFDLFQKLNSELEISLNLYTLVLDWLFIIGVIKNAEKRLIEKCF